MSDALKIKRRPTFAGRLQVRKTLDATPSPFAPVALVVHAVLAGADRTFTIAQKRRLRQVSALITNA
jgi:hypothetical protein